MVGRGPRAELSRSDRAESRSDRIGPRPDRGGSLACAARAVPASVVVPDGPRRVLGPAVAGPRAARSGAERGARSLAEHAQGQGAVPIALALLGELRRAHDVPVAELDRAQAHGDVQGQIRHPTAPASAGPARRRVPRPAGRARRGARAHRSRCASAVRRRTLRADRCRGPIPTDSPTPAWRRTVPSASPARAVVDASTPPRLADASRRSSAPSSCTAVRSSICESPPARLGAPDGAVRRALQRAAARGGPDHADRGGQTPATRPVVGLSRALEVEPRRPRALVRGGRRRLQRVGRVHPLDEGPGAAGRARRPGRRRAPHAHATARRRSRRCSRRRCRRSSRSRARATPCGDPRRARAAPRRRPARLRSSSRPGPAHAPLRPPADPAHSVSQHASARTHARKDTEAQAGPLPAGPRLRKRTWGRTGDMGAILSRASAPLLARSSASRCTIRSRSAGDAPRPVRARRRWFRARRAVPPRAVLRDGNDEPQPSPRSFLPPSIRLSTEP